MANYDRFEQTLHKFLYSPDFKQAVIDHLCHSRAWHYHHQSLRVELLANGTWIAPSQNTESKSNCIVVLTQSSYHYRKMEEIGEARDFEDILAVSQDEAREVAGKLYEQQESVIKQDTLKAFEWMRERGYLD